jgi:hypothetical protein
MRQLWDRRTRLLHRTRHWAVVVPTEGAHNRPRSDRKFHMLVMPGIASKNVVSDESTCYAMADPVVSDSSPDTLVGDDEAARQVGECAAGRELASYNSSLMSTPPCPWLETIIQPSR